MAGQVKSPLISQPAKHWRVTVLVIIGVLLVVLLVTWLNLPWRPDVSGIPPDSGFYAYIGKALLHGQVLYRDVWDDKPPLGYYLNATALAIFGQTPWGLWWSAVIWISVCTLLFFLILRSQYKGLTAGIACVFFLLTLMNPQLFQGGNMMEVYALAPQLGIIALIFLHFKHPARPWLAVFSGILTASAFLIKQPTIVLGCASILLIAIHQVSLGKFRQAFLSALRFIIGFSGLIVLVASYWLSIGALKYFVDGALLQGFSFIGGAQSHLREYFFYTLVNVQPNLAIGWLYLVALIVAGLFLVEKLIRFWLVPLIKSRLAWYEWFLSVALLIFPLVAEKVWPLQWAGKFWLVSIISLGLLIFLKFYRLPSRPEVRQVFSPLDWGWLVAVISLPFETLMASLGGRYFGHYFITMIPAVILVLAYPFWRMFSNLSSAVRSSREFLATATYFVPAILAIGGLGFSLSSSLPSPKFTAHIQAIFQNKNVANDLENYIIRTTNPADQVLVWHIHLGINFITDRKAPQRVLFPLNLFIPPTSANSRLQEFIDGLEASPPELILVQNISSLSLPFVDQPIEQSCDMYCTPEFVQALKVPQIDQQWHRLQDFFYAHYSLDTRIFDWKVYRRLP